MKLILVRHAQSEANAKGIFQDNTLGTPLSKQGIEQAKNLALRLKDEKIDAIYSSEMKRAEETANIIAKNHNVKVILDKRLNEFNSGTLRSKDELFNFFEKHRGEKGDEYFDVKTPGGESKRDHANKIESFLSEIIQKYKGTIIVISHGGTNKLFMGLMGHTPLTEAYKLKQENTCINELLFDDGKWIVHRLNCVKHLK